MKKLTQLTGALILFMTVTAVPVMGADRGRVIENFDDGSVVLQSYPGEDMQPDAWALDTSITYDDSPYSLRLYGNTWKQEAIPAMALDSSDVWQVAAYIEILGEVHGFGLCDSQHTLFYSFGGTEMLDIDQWVTVYQGAFPVKNWNLYRLPVGEDWQAYFGYRPKVTGIVFINDRDDAPSGSVYFDEIVDITDDLPKAPQVSIRQSIGDIFKDPAGDRCVTVQFYGLVRDEDSDYHDYYWSFGDDSTSRNPNPRHTYLIDDDHPYTVMLEVKDSTDLWGRASCTVNLDPGPTTFPLQMNFVGDIMLARRYENPGGVIDTAGVEAIFAPTRACLGDAADITVANLECPLTDRGEPHPTKPILIRGRPANVAGLVYAGIDVVSLANNHVIDYGLEGIRQTQDSLASNGILFSGAGVNSYEAYQPVFRLKNGINFAFLAACNRTGQYENTQPFFGAGFNKPGFAELSAFQIDRQVRGVRPDADLVVVETHSGNEYSPVPPRGFDADEAADEFYSIGGPVPDFDDIAIRHAAIDAGADLVVNHHPHRLQGFEVYQGKLIAHSLGNFAFDQNYAETFPSVILNAKIDATGFYEYTLVPVFIDDYLPRRAQGALGRYILDYVGRLSRDLNTYLITDRDRVTSRVALDKFSLVRGIRSCDSTVFLRDTAGYWISDLLRLRKEGSISCLQNLAPAGNWQFRLGRDILWFGNFEDEGCTMWLINQTDEFYDTAGYQGLRSFCQVRRPGSGQIVTNLEARIPCETVSSYYTLYGYLRTENAQRADMAVRFYASPTSGVQLGMSDLGKVVSGTTGWGFYSNEFRPASGTYYFDVNLRSQEPISGGVGYAWFDNAGIIAWSEWQDWNGPLAVSEPNDYYWLQIRRNTAASNAEITYEETDYQFNRNRGQNSVNKVFLDMQCFPIPFRKITTIRYILTQSTIVTLKVYNILGQLVRTLANEAQSPGIKIITWNGQDGLGRDLGAGIYFCRMQAGNMSQAIKIILVD
jgi:poly-gamma-glutamate capsule biosynthesis protein CapA/YwtB (metallophosphatase superfamily)